MCIKNCLGKKNLSNINVCVLIIRFMDLNNFQHICYLRNLPQTKIEIIPYKNMAIMKGVGNRFLIYNRHFK